MKKIGKLLGLILVLSMVICTFAACGEEKQNGGNGQEPKADPTEDIKAVVEDYMEAYTAFEMEDAMKFVDEDCDLYEQLEENCNIEEKQKAVAEKMNLDVSQQKIFVELMTDLMKKSVAAIEFEIGKVEVAEDGKSAVVEYSGKHIDDESYDLTAEFESAKLQVVLDDVEERLDDENGEYIQPTDSDVAIQAWKIAVNNVSEKWETKDVEKEIKLELIDDEWKIIEIETK